MRARGYTLMEVMVAMAILAMSLTVLLGTQASAARMSDRANNMALAALLARSKMIDIEHELLDSATGLPEMADTMRGDFRDEGFDDVDWEALIEVIEITDQAQESFNAQIYEQLFGAGDAGGALAGATGVSSFMPMIMSMVPEIMNDVASRARKVTLSISWEEGEREMTLTVQQYVVQPDGDAAQGVVGGGDLGGADPLEALGL